MYENLKMVMAQKDISIEKLAQLLNIHRNTVANKLNGDSCFDFDQAIIIANMLFPEYRPEFLFRRKTTENDQKGA